MTGLESRRGESGVASGGAGNVLPPALSESSGDDYGDFERWEEDQARWNFDRIVDGFDREVLIEDLDITASAVINHPSAFRASKEEIGDAYVNEQLMRMRSRFGDHFRLVGPLDNVVFLDDYRPERTVYNFPPPVA